jgi:hypothetical protein
MSVSAKQRLQALKGLNVKAQGAALGKKHPQREALKERNSGSRRSMPPFQGLRIQTDQFPRAAPRAIVSRPFWAYSPTSFSYTLALALLRCGLRP